MNTPFAEWRHYVLAQLQHAKLVGADWHLHLLYTPELHDPIPGAADERRQQYRVQPPANRPDMPLMAARDEVAPRLITLDCRLTAPYLLETDPAIDDPLLEDSINQAYAEFVQGQRADASLNNDDPGFSPFSIGGWLVGPEDATHLGARLSRFSQHHTQGTPVPIKRAPALTWVHWCNPLVLQALWPTLDANQRKALLGDNIWFALDGQGQLHQHAATDEAVPDSRTTHLHGDQQVLLKNLELVNDLVGRWQTLLAAQGQPLPPDAQAQVHTHVRAAQGYRLPASALPLYALTALQLAPGATQDPQWAALMRQASPSDRPLADDLAQLPDEFWARWALALPGGNTGTRQAAPSNTHDTQKTGSPR